MPICPICKQEYPTETTICPTCNVSLETPVVTTAVSVFSLRQESAAEHFVSYMHEHGLEGKCEYSMREDTYKIYVEKKDAMTAVKLLRQYMVEARKQKEVAAPAPAPEEKPEPEAEPTPVSEPEPEVEPTPAPVPVPEVEPEPVKEPEPAPIPEEVPTPAELPLPVEEPTPEPVEAPTLSEKPTKKLSLWERLRSSKSKQETEQEPVSEAEPALEQEPVVDQEPEPALEPEVAAKEEEIVAEPEPIEEPEPEPEPAVESEPVVEPEPVAEPDIPAMIAEAEEPEEPVAIEEAVEEPEIPVSAEEESAEEPTEDDAFSAFSAFLTDFKRSSISRNQELEKSGNAPIIEEILPNTAKDSADAASSLSAEPELQELKIKLPTDEEIIETVVDASAGEMVAEETSASSSSFADPSLSSDAAFWQMPKRKKFEEFEVDGLEEFKGFVPDYAPEEKKESAPPVHTPEEEAMLAFRQKVSARKEEKDRIMDEQKREADRKANLVKDLPNGQKIVFEDTEELDSYAGFVPDYTPNTDSEDDFAFYQPRTVSDYSKYKKKGQHRSIGANSSASSSLASDDLSHMRLTTTNEVENLFFRNIPAEAKQKISPQEIRSTTFLCSMTGAQLLKLFNSWLMMNVTQVSVRAFEDPEATPEENFNAKLEGIKNLLVDSFGNLDEILLDTIVRKYYYRYLDE